MTVEVWNMKLWYGGFDDPHTVRVDRTSVYGNPFIIGKHGDRFECVDQYEIYWDEALKHPDSPIGWSYYNRLLPLYKETQFVRLVCWCSPKICHADVIQQQLYSDTGHQYR